MARSLTLGVFALLLAMLAGGCVPGISGQQQLDPNAQQADLRLQRIEAAKAAAAAVLADVEACEATAIAGSSLGDMYSNASHARDSAQAFARSENGKLLPQSATELLVAAQDYASSCDAWVDLQKASQSPWPHPARLVDGYDRPSALLVQAGLSLGHARLALRDGK